MDFRIYIEGIINHMLGMLETDGHPDHPSSTCKTTRTPTTSSRAGLGLLWPPKSGSI